ncbi:MAG: hypothetical protein HQL57_08250 [Magnetococcales bacterium]|nr:hypothetical protein [Magnetococcales bacterium]
MARQPFHDPESLQSWEGVWADAWERPAVAFADTFEVMRCLKALMGWRSGDAVAADVLLEPAWREALGASWLHWATTDIDPVTARNKGAPLPPEGAPVRAWIGRHPFGLPSPPVSCPAGVMLLEEVSSLILPFPGSGWGEAQLLCLDGNRILQAGGTCLVLSRDERWIRELSIMRQHPPSAAASALGLSQWQGVKRLLELREALAHRYIGMRNQGEFSMPEAGGAGGRAWELFHLRMPSEESLRSLAAHLRVRHIAAASPVWHAVPAFPPWPGLKAFLGHALALPFHASLDLVLQKRVINRIHRWVERRPRGPEGG